MSVHALGSRQPLWSPPLAAASLLRSLSFPYVSECTDSEVASVRTRFHLAQIVAVPTHADTAGSHTRWRRGRTG